MVPTCLGTAFRWASCAGQGLLPPSLSRGADRGGDPQRLHLRARPDHPLCLPQATYSARFPESNVGAPGPPACLHLVGTLSGGRWESLFHF